MKSFWSRKALRRLAVIRKATHTAARAVRPVARPVANYWSKFLIANKWKKEPSAPRIVAPLRPKNTHISRGQKPQSWKQAKFKPKRKMIKPRQTHIMRESKPQSWKTASFSKKPTIKKTRNRKEAARKAWVTRRRAGSAKRRGGAKGRRR